LRIIDSLCGFFIAMLWGVSFLAMNIALEYFSPFMLNFLRCLTIVIILLPIINRTDLSYKHLIYFALTNGFFHYSILFLAIWLGVDLIPCIILLQSYVPFMYVISSIFFKKGFNVLSIYGILVSIIGLIIVAGEGGVIQSNLPLALVILSSLFLAIFNVQVTRAGEFDSLSMHAYTAIIAGVLSLIFSLVLEAPEFSIIVDMPISVAASVLIISVSTFVGFSIWANLLKNYPLVQVLPFPLLIPVFGVLFVVLFYDYTLTEELKYGGTITLLGVMVTVYQLELLTPKH
jgi:O-acetylserine/cysteine efflux transporter